MIFAEPNYLRSIPEPAAHQPGTEILPGDYYFEDQWALNNTGQEFNRVPWINGQELCFNSGSVDADIDAPEAWAISTGTPWNLVRSRAYIGRQVNKRQYWDGMIGEVAIYDAALSLTQIAAHFDAR